LGGEAEGSYRGDEGHAPGNEIAGLVGITGGHHTELAGGSKVAEVFNLLGQGDLIVEVSRLEGVGVLAAGVCVGELLSHVVSFVSG
jgi:hypothetical protein